MDPLRRLLLLGLVASVILTEPGSARASMALLGQQRAASQETAAIAGQLVQRLAAALEQEEQDAKVADASRRVTAQHVPDPTGPACIAQVGFVHAILSPHEFRPPPPVIEG